MSGETFDSERAGELACEHISAALNQSEEAQRSEVVRLIEAIAAVEATLENKERPDRQDIEEAYHSVERVRDLLNEVITLFEWGDSADDELFGGVADRSNESELLDDEDLVALRSNVEDGLSAVQYRGADQNDAARLLELYAHSVRLGHIYPPSRRGEESCHSEDWGEGS